MKKLIIITAILITGFITTTKSEIKIINHPGFEFGFFYSNLAPYGSWIEIDAGLVVWRPTIIHRGWAPYRSGRWIWTIDGWYWDSYEDFGYITYHYGRWYNDDYYGWIWVPDYDWAPSWVEWRYDDDYIGWAPLPPYAIFSISIGVHYTYDYYVPYNHWHFVRYRHFCDPYVYNYYLAPKYKYRVYNRTKYRNNYDYRDGRIINHGVDIDYVRTHTGQNIRQRDIQRVNDYKEVEKYRGKDTEAIRTFVASRDELSKTRNNDVRIEKKDKRSTLDVSKVKLGKDNNEIKERNIDRDEKSAGRDLDLKKNETVTKKDIRVRENNNTGNKKLETDKKRNDNIKLERNNKTKEFIPEKKIERNDVKKNEVKIEKNKDVNRKTEIKKENKEFIPEKKIERNDVKKTEVKTEKNAEVNRKAEVKKENTNKNNRVFEQQRQENKTQIKNDVKRNGNTNRNQTQNKIERKTDTETKNKRSR